MHVDEINVDEGSSVTLEDGTGEIEETVDLDDGQVLKGDVPAPQIKHGELLDDDAEDDADDVEYEYVNLSEATGGLAGNVKSFVMEHFVPIACVLIVAICLLIMAVGRHVNSVLIAVGFVFVAIIFAFVIYVAWKERKQAREEYEYAKKVHESVRTKLMEDIEEE